MKCYRDRTYCKSPNCKNECNRKMSEYEKRAAWELDVPVSYAYFCGEPEESPIDTKEAD